MSDRYPWYDSTWLTVYTLAKEFIAQNHPAKLPEFIHAFDVFRTDPNFSIKRLPQLFDDATLEELKSIIRQVDLKKAPSQEMQNFGRIAIHDIAYMNVLQSQITDLVGDVVGEAVEPCYNFLSLYWELGVCDVHMDAPFAKWTVDTCIEQSDVWPIHFSKIVPWPEDMVDPGKGWQDAIKNDPANQFESYTMQEGETLIFSGSSQWHYRDPIERLRDQNFCNLVFFHYIPAGTSELTVPANWKEIFDIPELGELKNPTSDAMVDLS